MKRILLLLLIMSGIAGTAQEKIKIACIGNSVTYGYGHKNPAETSYPTRLGAMLGEEYEVGNFGKSGATLLNKGHRPYTEQEEYKAALAFAPDIAVIHLGLNDTDPRNWPNYRDEFISDYMSLIDTLRTINPKVKVYVCRMTPIFHWHKRFKSGTRDWYKQIQEKIEEVASLSGAQLIDLQKELYDRPDLMPDALHPNPQGAEIIAKAVFSAITGEYGGLSLPAIYGDNMIIQRGKPFTVSGTADAGKKITARLGKQKLHTTAATDGTWAVAFDPLEADGKEYTLTVESDGIKIEINNILVGEVWLCSGQSNMAFMVKESSHKNISLDGCEKKNIRLYDMKPCVETNNVEWEEENLAKLNEHDYYLPASWQQPTEENVSNFSAVAWHFGSMLADSLGVPVGLICNAIGGATAESFIGRRTLEFHPALVDILYNWRDNDMIQEWCRERASLNIKKSDNRLQRHPYEPAYLYETGITPIAMYPIKGAIWYQGESDAHNVELHEIIFPTLVSCWRETFGDENMPFYFVQLSSIERPSWPHFRDSQRRLAESIDNCAFAVSSDKGARWNVHPQEKKPVGERLARRALHHTYRMSHITPGGPAIKKAERKGKTLVLTFENADGMRSSDGEALRTFEIAAEQGTFHPADKVEIKGNCIFISSGEVKIPARARYGWQPFTTANLINSDSLPASTFMISADE